MLNLIRLNTLVLNLIGKQVKVEQNILKTISSMHCKNLKNFYISTYIYQFDLKGGNTTCR